MVLHIDLNSFFARVEQQANPRLRGKSIGVLGKGHKGARTCVCAASPEAKRFGVKSGMSVGEAQRLCPAIILVPPNYPAYLDISRRFFAILDRFSPWVEIFSIDEGFLATNSKQKSQSGVPPTGGLHPSEVCLKRTKGDELSEAIKLAEAIKHTLRRELGELLTVSIGIAWGKVFAKLASNRKKPDGLTILTPEGWLAQVGYLPVTELCGINHRVARRLNPLNIQTIHDLTKADAGLLATQFGPSLGMRLWQIGQGIDRSPVIPSATHLPPPKSMGHQVTLDRPIPLERLWPMIALLTQKVGRRLRRAQLVATRFDLHLVFSNGEYNSNFINQSPSSSDRNLLHAARKLFERTTSDTDPHPSTLVTIVTKVLSSPNKRQWQRVQRVGITAYQLTSSFNQSLPLFPEHHTAEQLTAALDAIHDRFGNRSIEWGSSAGATTGDLRDWRGPRAVLDI